MAITKRQELSWQAEDDARTLAAYQEIIGDKKRLDRAVGAAKKQAENLTSRAKALTKGIGKFKNK